MDEIVIVRSHREKSNNEASMCQVGLLLSCSVLFCFVQFTSPQIMLSRVCNHGVGDRKGGGGGGVLFRQWSVRFPS